MSLQEENEKRDRQLRKEADLFRTGYLAGLNAAIETTNEVYYKTSFGRKDVIEALQALKEAK